MKKILLLLWLIVGVTICGWSFTEKYLLQIPLPQPDNSVLGSFVTQPGRIYRFTFYAENIPANVHGWKAKFKFALKNEKTGETIYFEGSPKRYLYRKTDGNGYSYYVFLTFYLFRSREETRYTLKLVDSKLNLPLGARSYFLVVERIPSANGWWKYVLIGIGILILIILFFKFSRRYDYYDEEEDDDF